MEAVKVLRDIKKGEILPCYLLWGEEEYLKKKILEELKKSLLDPGMISFNFDLFEEDRVSPGEIKGRAETPPVLSDKRLILVKNPPFFGEEKKGKEREDLQDLMAYLKNPSPHTCLIFTAKKIDKRKAITRFFIKNDAHVECNTVKEGDLRKWIKQKFRQEGKEIEIEALEKLIEMVGRDLTRLENEIIKLSTYLGEDKSLSREQVEALVTGSLETNIFSLVDSLGKKNKKEALNQLQGMLLQGEPPLKILTMIARQFRLLLQVKTLENSALTRQEIIKELKLPPFVVTKLFSQGYNFTREELKYALIKSHEADLKIKRGQLEGQTSLELLITGLK